MTYARKTFEDDSRIKRFFQRGRLKGALRLASAVRQPKTILDFGAGNGELCRQLAGLYPQAEIICYEPHPELREQARQNLAGMAQVRFVHDPAGLPPRTADLLFCLEVFEHLPEREFKLAMEQLVAALRDDGFAVIGVPIETGLPALYKGIFRALRRFGEFDARPAHVFAALAGRPPADRPVVELLPGSWYHLHHLGFDHRNFSVELEKWFRPVRMSTSPFPVLGAAVNAEANFLVRKRPG